MNDEKSLVEIEHRSRPVVIARYSAQTDNRSINILS